MARFPEFRSGAVAQYGSGFVTSFSTQIHRFLDGTEQSYRMRGPAGRRWLIRAEWLDETELARLETFFVEMRGSEGSFEFVDPATGEACTNCSFETGEIELRSAGIQKGSVQLMIRENQT